MVKKKLITNEITENEGIPDYFKILVISIFSKRKMKTPT